ncbi:MAG: hypothetical protein JKX78_06270 [Alteromonadaceae bacterium]|nr:hypothetical protein [Alteromonadaceae bacterium]
MSDIKIFESKSGAVQVKLEQDTVWLSQITMAKLFETSADNISLHLKNIYSEAELEETSTTEDYSVVRKEGNPIINDTGLAALTLLVAESATGSYP